MRRGGDTSRWSEVRRGAAPVGPEEAGERWLAERVPRWRAALEALDVDDPHEALTDAVTAQMARALHFDVSDWHRAPAPHRHQATELLAQSEAPDPLWREPHTLGWFHQHYGALERDASFHAHHHREQKHANATVSTQLYTPRWIADLLARRALALVDPAGPASVCDPAVGGGQMLLAALGALADAHPEATSVELARCLHGVDLDARAVDVARRSLKLAIARHAGRRCPESEALLDAQIRRADGLFDDPGRTFDVVLTNPPYMGSRSMPKALKARVRARFHPFHGDLYVAFLRRCHELATDAIGVLAQQTVWYLSSYAAAREALLATGHLDLFVHLGPHAFASLDGEKANVVAFVQRSREATAHRHEPSIFVDLRDRPNPDAKREAWAALVASTEPGPTVRCRPVARFERLPGTPLAHWLPDPVLALFDDGLRLGDVADIPGSQNKTGDNRRFVRPFDAVPPASIRPAPPLWPHQANAGTPHANDAPRWVFYSKGGPYAPWWGNWRWVIDWSDEARHFYATNRTSNLLDERYWFREGICYTDFGGQRFNARWMPPGCLFDMAGPAIFPRPEACPDGIDEHTRLFALLAVLNSSVARELLNALNPSIHYQVRDLRNLPLPAWTPADERRLAADARRLVDDLRLLSAFVDGTPASAPNLPEAAHRQAREAAASFSAREQALDAAVAELYGCADWPPDRDTKKRPAILRAFEKQIGQGQAVGEA